MLLLRDVIHTGTGTYGKRTIKKRKTIAVVFSKPQVYLGNKHKLLHHRGFSELCETCLGLKNSTDKITSRSSK